MVEWVLIVLKLVALIFAVTWLAVVVILRVRPYQPWYSSFLFIGKPKFHFGGTVAPGFEGVQDAFQQNFHEGYEKSAQFVVYHRGKRVVDLWGSSDSDYDGDCVQVTMSSSKVMTAIVVAKAVERGLFKYHDPVAKHWPEFAARGKDRITIADVLRHEAGLSGPGWKSIPVDDLAYVEKVGRILSAAEPQWREDTRRCYHGLTRGLILNELFRRVSGQTIGEYLHESVAKPLKADVYLGSLPLELEHKCSTLTFYPQFLTAVDYLGRTFLGWMPGVPPMPKAKADMVRDTFKGKKSVILQWLTVLQQGERGSKWFDTRFGRTVESPSTNCVVSARGMARVIDSCLEGATKKSFRVLKTASTELSLMDSKEAFDEGMKATTSFSQGGFNAFGSRTLGGDVLEGYHGWGGFGGSLAVMNPAEEVAVAYTITGLGSGVHSGGGWEDTRCLRNMRALKEALAKIR